MKSFWHQLVEGAGLDLTYEAARRYHNSRDPSVDYLAAVSEVFGYRLGWLASGDPPKLQQVEELRRERMLSKIVGALDSKAEDFIDSMPTGENRRASQRRKRALRRFARRLIDAEFPEAPWYTAEERERLLLAAMEFLVGVEQCFQGVASNGRHSGDTEGGVAGRWRQGVLLEESSSDAWYVLWSDRILDLFAMRVEGLGVRTGGLLDSHKPASPRG